MIIKSFAADSSAAALKLVRQEMGGDAIVLKTRCISGASGSHIEVTACLEKPSVAQSSVLLAAENVRVASALDNASNNVKPAKRDSQPKKADNTNRLEQAERSGSSEEKVPDKITVKLDAPAHNASLSSRINAIERKLDELIAQGSPGGLSHFTNPELNSIANVLLSADFSRKFIHSFIASLEDNIPSDGKFHTAAHRRLVSMLSEQMTPSMKFKAGDSLMFMGPAGSGKTSLMGKMAVRLVAQEGMKVCLATLDDHKLAAQDELHSFACLLGVDAAELDRASQLDRSDKGMITLIDTPAMPIDPAKFEKLCVDINTLNPSHRFAVFSALTRTADTIEIAQRMTALSPTNVIVTMLDQTRRYGSIISAAKASGAKIAFVTNAPGGIGEANVPDPDLIARTVLKTEAAIESTETK